MHLLSFRLAERRAALGAIAGIILLFFFGLGAFPLLDPDEPVYGQVAREMVTTGNWLTPHLAGRLWFDKPPLFYWASAAAISLLGPTEVAARVPSALSAALLAILVFALGRHFFGRQAGWVGAVVLATSLQTIILARGAVTDMLFALTLTAALGSFALWYERKAPSGVWAALCGASLGMAILCKGPVALLLVGAAGLVFLLWERQLRRLASVDVLVALLCCLIVAGPWYGAMLTLHRREFIEQFIVANNLQRFTRPEHEQHATLFYFVPVLVVGLFPWSAFLPHAASLGRRTPAGRLLLSWSALIFAFFSISSTRLVTYIYPLYPAVALLIGAGLTEMARGVLQREHESGNPRPFGPAPVAGTLVIGALMAVGLAILAQHRFPAAQPGALLLAGLLLGGTTWACGRAWRGAPPIGIYAGMMTALAVLLAVQVAPRVAPSVSLRELVLWADATPRPLVGYRLRAPGFLFYAGRELPYIGEPEALAEQVRATPHVAVAMSRRALSDIATAWPDLEWRVLWQRGNRVVAEPVRRSAAPEGSRGTTRQEVP
jgi:4-amino-4-deoxy-L-arabinose transferase-like glycosyltransferase